MREKDFYQGKNVLFWQQKLLLRGESPCSAKLAEVHTKHEKIQKKKSFLVLWATKTKTKNTKTKKNTEFLVLWATKTKTKTKKTKPKKPKNFWFYEPLKPKPKPKNPKIFWFYEPLKPKTKPKNLWFFWFWF